MADQQDSLPEQICLTKDWKLIKINTLIVYRIFRPVAFLVNVQEPIKGTKLMCATILRDIAARLTFQNMFDNKKQVCEEMKVNSSLFFCLECDLKRQ